MAERLVRLTSALTPTLTTHLAGVYADGPRVWLTDTLPPNLPDAWVLGDKTPPSGIRRFWQLEQTGPLRIGPTRTCLRGLHTATLPPDTPLTLLTNEAEALLLTPTGTDVTALMAQWPGPVQLVAAPQWLPLPTLTQATTPLFNTLEGATLITGRDAPTPPAVPPLITPFDTGGEGHRLLRQALNHLPPTAQALVIAPDTPEAWHLHHWLKDCWGLSVARWEGLDTIPPDPVWLLAEPDLSPAMAFLAGRVFHVFWWQPSPHHVGPLTAWLADTSRQRVELFIPTDQLTGWVQAHLRQTPTHRPKTTASLANAHPWVRALEGRAWPWQRQQDGTPSTPAIADLLLHDVPCRTQLVAGLLSGVWPLSQPACGRCVGCLTQRALRPPRGRWWGRRRASCSSG